MEPGRARPRPEARGHERPRRRLDERHPVLPARRDRLGRGHATFVDSPWALTALTQAQFWRDDFAATYGDGTAVDCLSVDISNWDEPGILYGKPAKQCTAEEVKNEVWAQLKAHLEDNGESVLPDGVLHSWFLDPAIKWNPATGTNSNDEPLLINTVNSWDLRPEATTAIPNLFLAGDYVRTDIDLATMEGANESGRAATNAILDASDSTAERATMYKLYDPPEFKALKKVDAQRYKRGQRNLFHVRADRGPERFTPGRRAGPGPTRSPARSARPRRASSARALATSCGPRSAAAATSRADVAPCQVSASRARCAGAGRWSYSVAGAADRLGLGGTDAGQLGQHVGPAGDQHGLAVADGLMRAAGLLGRDRARNRHRGTAQAIGPVQGVEGAAAPPCLDDDRAAGERGDEPVAGQEARLGGHLPGRLLADDQPALGDPAEQRGVGARVVGGGVTSEDGHRRPDPSPAPRGARSRRCRTPLRSPR